MVNSVPMEWIDKLFKCMEEFYGARWTQQFSKGSDENLHKTLWQSALYGCTYDEIRGALVYLKRAAESPGALPPIHMEFWRYAKGKSKPWIDYGQSKRSYSNASNEVATRTLEEINRKLRYKEVRG